MRKAVLNQQCTQSMRKPNTVTIRSRGVFQIWDCGDMLQVSCRARQKCSLRAAGGYLAFSSFRPLFHGLSSAVGEFAFLIFRSISQVNRVQRRFSKWTYQREAHGANSFIGGTIIHTAGAIRPCATTPYFSRIRDRKVHKSIQKTTPRCSAHDLPAPLSDTFRGSPFEVGHLKTHLWLTATIQRRFTLFNRHISHGRDHDFRGNRIPSP
jgi:hypothetical protein